MKKTLAVLVLLQLAAGCAAHDPAEMAERMQREPVTGSHIKKAYKPGDENLQVGTRQDLEQYQDKNMGVRALPTGPREAP
jgi:hypothetical protein